MPISGQPIALFSQAANTASTDRYRRNQQNFQRGAFQEEVATDRAAADAQVAADAYQQAQSIIAKGVDPEQAWQQVMDTSPELFSGLAGNPRALEGANSLRLSAMGGDDDRRFVGLEEEVDPITGKPTGQMVRKFANAKTKSIGPETKGQTADDGDEVVRIGRGAAMEELVRGAMASAGKYGHTFGEGGVSAAVDVNRAHSQQTRNEEAQRYRDLVAMGEADNAAALQQLPPGTAPAQDTGVRPAEGGYPLPVPLSGNNKMASDKLVEGTANQAPEAFDSRVGDVDKELAKRRMARDSIAADPHYRGTEEQRAAEVAQIDAEIDALVAERGGVDDASANAVPPAAPVRQKLGAVAAEGLGNAATAVKDGVVTAATEVKDLVTSTGRHSPHESRMRKQRAEWAEESSRSFSPDAPLGDRMDAQRKLASGDLPAEARKEGAATYTAGLPGVANLPPEQQVQVVDAGAQVIGTTRTPAQIQASARMMSRVQHTAAQRTPQQLRAALYMHSLNQMSTPALEKFVAGQAIAEPPVQKDNFTLTRDGRVFDRRTGKLSDPAGMTNKDFLATAKANNEFNETVAGQALSGGYAKQYSMMEDEQREAAAAGTIAIAMQGRQLFMNMLETNDSNVVDINSPEISQDIRTMLLTIASDVYMDQLEGNSDRWWWQKPKDTMSHVSQHPMFKDVIEELRGQGIAIRQ